MLGHELDTSLNPLCKHRASHNASTWKMSVSKWANHFMNEDWMNECFCTNVNRQASALSETHQHISDKYMPLLSKTHMPQLNTSTKTSASFYQTNLNAHMCTPTRYRPTHLCKDTEAHTFPRRYPYTRAYTEMWMYTHAHKHRSTQFPPEESNSNWKCSCLHIQTWNSHVNPHWYRQPKTKE